MSRGLGRSYSVSLEGISGRVIEVEADIGQALPAFVLLGLPDSSLKEARERIRSAAKNSNHPLPARKLTVNLLPAGIPKRGPGFDLAIVIAALHADGRIRPPGDVVFLGELALDGRLRPVTGILPAVMASVAAGHKHVVCPRANHREASLVPGVQVTSFDSLPQVLEWLGSDLQAGEPLSDLPSLEVTDEGSQLDFCEVIGQPEACQAAVVAAAGGHHLLLVGPPGVGKTMIAERMPSIMPPLTAEEALDVSAIRSASGLTTSHVLQTEAPVEQPHHTATPASLLGGGGHGLIRPGAVSRAHNGVLFLDEACEFDRRCLDGLRQPLETGQISIYRAGAAVTLPARFQLVLATNPCPCGFDGSLIRDCLCSSLQRRRYFSRLSGPILDRVDVRVRMRAVGDRLLSPGEDPLSSEQAGLRVVEARARARGRLAPFGAVLNSAVPGDILRGPLRLSSGVTRDLDAQLSRGQISARGYDRVLRLAWTLADLDGDDSPGQDHVALAFILRDPEGLTLGH